MTTLTHDSIYTQHHNGVHELVFLEASEQAVCDYLNLMQQATHAAADDDTMTLILLDLRVSGMLSTGHLAEQMNRFNASRLVSMPSRTAILYQDGATVAMAANATRLMVRPGLDTFKFFHGDQRANAIAWLLACCPI